MSAAPEHIAQGPFHTYPRRTVSEVSSAAVIAEVTNALEGAPSRDEKLAALAVLKRAALAERWHTKNERALAIIEEHVGRPWTVAVGDEVRLLDEAEVYVGDEPHRAPPDAHGIVVHTHLESPDFDDAELVVEVKWMEGLRVCSGMAYLNHEKWVERV